MTSNEEMAEKLAEKFYGLIEGDVSVSGGELAKLFVTALDQAGLALSEKAKAYISFEPVLPNGKTLADMFASSDRKPLGTVIDDEDDEEEDDGPDDAGELDELEHMRDVADMAYAALSDLALHCHNRREDVAWGIASSAAKDAHVLATFVGDWIEDMEAVYDTDALAQHIIDCAEVINRLLTYPKDARRAVLYDNLHDSLATFEESAPDYPDPDDDADETDRGEAVDPTTGEIK